MTIPSGKKTEVFTNMNNTISISQTSNDLGSVTVEIDPSQLRKIIEALEEIEGCYE